jgi:hypothetical protein
VGENEDGTNEELDLVVILEKIRRLEYNTVEQYKNDLEFLRVQCVTRLTRIGALQSDSLTGLQGPGKMIYDALETILEAAEIVLERHQRPFRTLERSINDRQEADSSDLDELYDAQARQYWRKECERDVLGCVGVHKVPARTLDGWCFFVNEGPSVNTHN